jgi:hypothetical protein
MSHSSVLLTGVRYNRHMIRRCNVRVEDRRYAPAEATVVIGKVAFVFPMYLLIPKEVR